jgi:hypothetical protein
VVCDSPDLYLMNLEDALHKEASETLAMTCIRSKEGRSLNSILSLHRYLWVFARY